MTGSFQPASARTAAMEGRGIPVLFSYALGKAAVGTEKPASDE